MSGSSEAKTRADLIARLSEDPAHTAILTDVDGTIAPITRRPEQTVVPEPARRALEGLAGSYALVACISGRPAAEVRELVGVETISYAGNHGLEILDAGSRHPRLDPQLRGREHAAASFVDGLDPSRLQAADLRREDKGPIQALHWRGASSEAAARQVAEAIASEASQAGLEPHWGRKVLEIRPPGGGGKAAAVASLLDEVEGTVGTACYAGDDRTDLDAFRSLRDLEREADTAGERPGGASAELPTGGIAAGICVGILSSEGPPGLEAAADFVLESPEEWIEVLERLGG